MGFTIDAGLVIADGTSAGLPVVDGRRVPWWGQPIAAANAVRAYYAQLAVLEQQAIALLGQGQNDDQIAALLGLSADQVRRVRLNGPTASFTRWPGLDWVGQAPIPRFQ